MTETLIKFGQKAVITDDGVAEGWLAPFGGPMKGNRDLDGETFTAKTAFGLDYYPTLPILYGHGQDGEVGADKVGEITIKEIRDKGLWVQGQLDRQGKYYDALRELAEKGDLYWSSGAIAHLVEKDAKGYIKQWPIAEATLTLTPANPWATASVKDSLETEPASLTAAARTVTFTYQLKEGRRHNARDAALLQQIHQLISELGTPEPQPVEAAGEAAEPEPTKDLASAGDNVEPVSDADLSELKGWVKDTGMKAIREALHIY